MSLWAYISVLGLIIVLGLYLSNAFERIAEIEARSDTLEAEEEEEQE